jgi:hypothetical protein
VQNPTQNNPAGPQIHADPLSILLKIEALLSSYKNLPGHALLEGERREATAQRLDGTSHITFLLAGAIALATLAPDVCMAVALVPAAQHRVMYRQDTQMANHPETRILIAPVYQAEPAEPQPVCRNL